MKIRKVGHYTSRNKRINGQMVYKGWYGGLYRGTNNSRIYIPRKLYKNVVEIRGTYGVPPKWELYPAPKKGKKRRAKPRKKKSTPDTVKKVGTLNGKAVYQLASHHGTMKSLFTINKDKIRSYNVNKRKVKALSNQFY